VVHRPVVAVRRGERNVGGDDDGPFGGTLHDVVVGLVGTGRDQCALDERRLRNGDRAVADDKDLQSVPFGDAIDFLLHRAGVGVDQDQGRGGSHRPLLSRLAGRRHLPVFRDAATRK